MALDKHVFLYSEDAKPIIGELKKQGRALKDLLGGKGANLMLMTPQASRKRSTRS